MAYVIGDAVFVPVSQLDDADDYPFALYRTAVQETKDRSVKVGVRGGGTSGWIASSKCHDNLGILILNVGDNLTESSLLDPLAKSLLQFCRLVVEDSYVRLLKVRSVAEMAVIWNQIHAAYSHVLLIGHGDGARLKFAVDDWVGSEDVGQLISPQDVSSKLILSLTCSAGRQAFGGVLSLSAGTQDFIGPMNAVHGAVASQFAQSFLAYQLLVGETVKVAFRHAKAGVPGSSVFRLWRAGSLQAT